MTDPGRFQLWVEEEGKGAQAKRRLLEAAVLVFGNRGLEGATVREIAKAAGQNVAAVGYYFGSKEGLYHAIIRGIAAELPRRMGDVLEEIRLLRSGGGGASAQATELLQKFVRTHFLRSICRPEMIPLSRIVVREQTEPTPAFDLLYQLAIKSFHESLCFLAGLASGRPPDDPEVIIRAHSILGQMFSFVFARETILRRLNWQNLEGRNAERIADVLAENVAALMAGLQRPSRRLDFATKKSS